MCPIRSRPVSGQDSQSACAQPRSVCEQPDIRRDHTRASQDQYRGLRDSQVAFGLCALLEELARHLRDLDEALRRRVVELCKELFRAW